MFSPFPNCAYIIANMDSVVYLFVLLFAHFLGRHIYMHIARVCIVRKRSLMVNPLVKNFFIFFCNFLVDLFSHDAIIYT